VICTTINKMCASGMKSVMFAAQSIMLGHNDVVMAGGMENMSRAPYYVERRLKGKAFGHQQLKDGMILDGLWDVYKNIHMGQIGEICASEMSISRSDQVGIPSFLALLGLSSQYAFSAAGASRGHDYRRFSEGGYAFARDCLLSVNELNLHSPSFCYEEAMKTRTLSARLVTRVKFSKSSRIT
jgi:hypothetical protein